MPFNITTVDSSIAWGRSKWEIQVLLLKQYFCTYFIQDPLNPPTVNIVLLYFQKAIGKSLLGVGIFARVLDSPVLFIFLKVEKH